MLGHEHAPDAVCSQSTALFLAPDFGKTINAFIVIPSAIAEVWMVGYLLVIGVKTATPIEQSEHACGGAVLPACEMNAAA